MRPTSVSVLIVAALAAAAVGWLMLSVFKYSLVPLLPWSPVVVLAGIAAVEAVLAQNTAARIHRKPGTTPVDPLAVARYVALAKASALVGALWTGYSASMLTWLFTETTQAARDDRPIAIGGLVAGMLLVGAALWLERACRVPRDPDRTEENDPDRPSGRR
jgi:uncharacterized protein (DUF983 family)